MSTVAVDDSTVSRATLSIKQSTNDCVPAPDGLVLWLPGEGNGNDLAGDHNAVLFGGVSFSEGMVGQTFDFDGIDDCLDVWDGFDLEVFTFAMWIREGDVQVEYADILDTDHRTSVGIVVQLTPNTEHDYYVAVGDTPVSGVRLSPGIWQHFAFSRNSEGVINVFLDGELIGSKAGGPIEYHGFEFLRLARWGEGGRHWKGQIDEFDIYNRALSAEEVRNLRAAGSRGKCPPARYASAGMRADGWRVLRTAAESDQRLRTESGNGFHVRQWNTANGLPSSRVQALLQTRDGYLWAGLQNGIVRLTSGAVQVPGVKPACTSLAQDDSGTIWIGSRDGLFRCDDLRISRVPLPDSETLRDKTITALVARKTQGIWAADGNGIFSLGKEGFVRYGIVPSVERLVKDRHGLWILNKGNGLHFDPKNGRLSESVSVARNLPVFAGFLLRNGTLLFGTEKSSVLQLDEEKATMIPAEGLPPGAIRAVAQDINGTLWAGGDQGLWLMTQTNLLRPARLPKAFRGVTALHANAEGGIWVGTESDGIFLLSENPIRTLTIGDGLPGNAVTSVCRSRDDSVWVATRSGVAQVSGNDVRPVHKPQLAEMLPACIVEDSRGVVWVGGFEALRGDGLVSINSPDDLSISALVGWFRDVSSLAPGPNGSLWIVAGDGSSSGLYLLTNNVLREASIYSGGFPVRPKFLFVDSRSNLWHSTSWPLREGPDGPASYDTGFHKGAVAVQWEDSEGALWLASEKQGVIRLKHGRAASIESSRGFASDLILGIVADDFGRLWFNSHQGIFWAKKSELDQVADRKRNSVHCVGYSVGDGLLNAEGNGGTTPNSCKGADGKLYFPTVAGLAVADPARTLHDDTPSPVHIGELIANGAILYSNVPAFADPPRSPGGLSAIRIKPGHADTITVHFVCNSFLHPERIRYRYRLAGRQNSWIDAGSQSFAQFQNLPPGDYRLEVMAGNSRGVWSEAETPLAFTIQPFFYQTWTFRGAILLSGGLLAGAFERYRRKVNARMVALEKDAVRAQERERLARDLHDDLGATLTRIALLARVHPPSQVTAPPSSRIADLADSALAGMNELIWSTNPKYDSLDSSLAYLHECAEDVFRNSPVAYSFSTPALDALAGFALPPEARRHLLLIFKEAVRNILKHAQANRVEIRAALRQSDGSNCFLVLTLRDNGCGFDLSRPAAAGHHGLDNMRKRAAAVGGETLIQSAPGAGTFIEIAMPLARAQETNAPSHFKRSN